MHVFIVKLGPKLFKLAYIHTIWISDDWLVYNYYYFFIFALVNTHGPTHTLIKSLTNITNSCLFLRRGRYLTTALSVDWQRVAVFGWLAVQGKILTMDNLCLWNMIIVNAYPLCLQAEESVDHLLLNCVMAQGMWLAFLNLFGCQWMLSRRVLYHFLAWSCAVGSKRGTMMWHLSFMAGTWSLWKERNVRCFDGCSSLLQVAVERAKFWVASWASVLPFSTSIPIDLILFKWGEVASVGGD